MPASETLETIETLNLFGEDVTLIRCEDDTCRQWAPALINCACCRKMLCAACYRRHQEARHGAS